MENKIIQICKNINNTVDFTRTDLIDNALIDSITLVGIATALMDEFKIEISYDEITPLNFNSINAMKELVEKYV